MVESTLHLTFYLEYKAEITNLLQWVKCAS